MTKRSSVVLVGVVVATTFLFQVNIQAQTVERQWHRVDDPSHGFQGGQPEPHQIHAGDNSGSSSPGYQGQGSYTGGGQGDDASVSSTPSFGIRTHSNTGIVKPGPVKNDDMANHATTYEGSGSRATTYSTTNSTHKK